MLEIKKKDKKFFVFLKRDQKKVTGIITFLRDYCKNTNKELISNDYNIPYIFEKIPNDHINARFLTIIFDINCVKVTSFFLNSEIYKDRYSRGDSLNDLKTWIKIQEKVRR